MVSNIIYRLVAFADFTNLGFTKENRRILESTFEGEHYSILQLPELNVLGTAYQGIRLVSTDDAPVISISSQRIEVIKGSDKKTGFNDNECEIVRKQLVQYMKRVYDSFYLKIQDSNRLAWVSQYAYFEIDDAAMDGFRDRFLRPIGYYNGKFTDEFSAKYAGIDEKEIYGNLEKLNVISTINRWFPGQGTGFVADVDGYSVEIDINTVASNKKNRFSEKSFSDFVAAADKMKADIAGEIFDGCN